MSVGSCVTMSEFKAYFSNLFTEWNRTFEDCIIEKEVPLQKVLMKNRVP